MAVGGGRCGRNGRLQLGLWRPLVSCRVVGVPDRQGRGIGHELLSGIGPWQEGGWKQPALITFTFNTVSQGLYIRHGLFPRLPIYNFNVAREALTGRLQGTRLRCERIEAERGTPTSDWRG